MGAIMNGIKVHGGTRPYGGTFLTFSDYMRPAVRLSALMRLPVIYVWTHDSIGLGEDGPTHQPIEHLAALRVIPGLDVVRPADANETAACWAEMLRRKDRPAGLMPDPAGAADRAARRRRFRRHLRRGQGGVRARRGLDGDPDVILIGTGSEVQYAVEAQRLLADEGISARVVSMPCREWFDEQDQAYRDSVIPPTVKARVSVEAGSRPGLARHRRRRRPDHQHRPLRRERVGEPSSSTSSASPAPRSPRRPRRASAAAGSTAAPTHRRGSGTQGPGGPGEHPGVTIS